MQPTVTLLDVMQEDSFIKIQATSTTYLSTIFKLKITFVSFWDDFIEEYCEEWGGTMFNHPSAFLDQQVGLMAIDLVKAIFEKQQEYYMPLDKFKQIVSEMSASDLWDLVD